MFLRSKLLNVQRFVKVCKRCSIHSWAYVNSIFVHRHGRHILQVTAAIGVLAGVGGTLLTVFDTLSANGEKRKKKMVILGSGWGAVNFIKHLNSDLYDVSVVSPTNYFLFTPFLPSVTVGTVEPRSIVEPIRRILGKKKSNSLTFYEAECYNVDTKNQRVYCKDVSGVVGRMSEFDLSYDVLVVAVGAETQTYNTPGLKEHAHFLKDIKDVQGIRNDIMDCLESAGYPGQTEEEVKRLLSFVVVGGGPTGVEFAAELHDFLKKELKKQYPYITDKMSITLIGGHNKLLSAFDEEISHYVEEKFCRDDIHLMQSRVTGVGENMILVKEKGSQECKSLPFGLCVWAAGIAPRALTKQMISAIPEQKNRNALITDCYLQVKNASGVFAIGDCGTVEHDRLEKNVDELFSKADVNKDGLLSLSEFQDIMEEAMVKYPHLSLHFKKAYKKSLKGAFDAIDSNKDRMLSVDEFRTFLKQVDCDLKSLPATAQVAAQQGKYLGKLLSNYGASIQQGNSTDFETEGATPFIYHHLGSFAYVGGDRAVLNLPIIGSFMGLGTMWLWRATYTSECVGWRMKAMILFDWFKTSVFGRDTSRI